MEKLITMVGPVGFILLTFWAIYLVELFVKYVYNLIYFSILYDAMYKIDFDDEYLK